MKNIKILELWFSGSHESKLLYQVGAFESKDLLEKYILLNPAKSYLHQFYKTVELQIIESL